MSPGEPPAHPNYITVYESIGGWKAVQVWWNPDGFYEPWETGLGAYETQLEAEAEARWWAKDEGLEYKEKTDGS